MLLDVEAAAQSARFDLTCTPRQRIPCQSSIGHTFAQTWATVKCGGECLGLLRTEHVYYTKLLRQTSLFFCFLS